MASRGASYQKILEKYFPGTVVKRDVKKPAESKADVFPELYLKSQDSDLDGSQYRNAIASGQSCAYDFLRKLISSGPTRRYRVTVLTSSNTVFRLLRQSLFPATLEYRYPGVAGHTGNFRLLSISSEHFRLTYPADVDRRTVDQVLNTLESTRTDYLRRASSTSSTVNIPRLEIRLNESTGDFTSRTGQPWWAAAATHGNRIELQPVGILKERGVLFTTLRHELAHVVIDSVSNKRAPRWLEEGFALYLAGEAQVISRYATRDRLTEDELEQRLQRPRTQEEMRTLYANACLMVAEMIRRQDEPSVWNKLAGY
jgi:hypothetical protein